MPNSIDQLRRDAKAPGRAYEALDSEAQKRMQKFLPNSGQTPYGHTDIPFAPYDENLLSALYGGIGHANNMVLGRWLLENGANPNDGVLLYHATELGHHDGLKLLLEFGADPTGTNALLRALNLDDLGAMKFLLDAGADAHPGQVVEAGFG